MKESPILFSAPMVRAILAGAKTQTRRLVGAPGDWAPIGPEAFSPTVIDRNGDEEPGPETYGAGNADGSNWIRCPYGQPGDRLWVREAWKAHTTFDHLPPRGIPRSHVWYMADEGYKAESRYRHARFMPRRFSRILLEVIAVSVERLQDISEADAVAEGCKPIRPELVQDGLIARPGRSAVEEFRAVWEEIHGEGSWDANPFV